MSMQTFLLLAMGVCFGVILCDVFDLLTCKHFRRHSSEYRGIERRAPKKKPAEAGFHSEVRRP